jgi:hypothetical protein
MTWYEPKWSTPDDGSTDTSGEYEAWLEFKSLVEAGHLVPVEPDYGQWARRIIEWTYEPEGEILVDLLRELGAGIGGDA